MNLRKRVAKNGKLCVVRKIRKKRSKKATKSKPAAERKKIKGKDVDVLFVFSLLPVVLICVHTNKLFYRAPDKVRIFIPRMHIFSPNPMFDHLLESSHRDDSNKWSNIGLS